MSAPEDDPCQCHLTVATQRPRRRGSLRVADASRALLFLAGESDRRRAGLDDAARGGAVSAMYDALPTAHYRVWHIPQIPGKAFTVDTDDLAYAKALLDVLADYDLFQYENKIKPDYTNANGVVVWDEESNEYTDVDLDDEDLP